MRRLLLLGVCGLLLACAGVGESLLEEVADGAFEIRHDGMDIGMPGGGHMRMDWRDAATHPAEIPLSVPPDSTIEASAVISFPDTRPAYFVAYQSPASREALISRYRQELEAMGLDVAEKTEAPDAITLVALDGIVAYIVTIAAKDGHHGVVLGVGTEEALEQGMAAAPQ